MDTKDFKGEIDYRKQQAEYYFSNAKDFVFEKLSPLPKPAQYTVLAIVPILLFTLLFKACSGGGGEEGQETPPPATVVTMPNITQQKKIDAEQKLGTLGLNNLQETPLSGLTSGDPNDVEIIVQQAPKAGEQVKGTDKIVLTYASKNLYEKSKTNAKVPDAIGLTVPKAREFFKDKGFVNVVFPLRTSESLKDTMMVVKSVTPEVGSPVTLNSQVKVEVEPGFDMDELKKKLADEYIPYGTFEKIERAKERDLKITLKPKGAAVKSKGDADNLARVHKLSIEKILGESIGNVTLVAPGGKITGESKNVSLKSTTSGITVPIAQEFCLREAGRQYSEVTVNWDKDTLVKRVDASSVTLMATANMVSSTDAKQQVVMSCTVTGSPNDLSTSSFTIQ